MDRWEVERAIRASELPPLARLVALSLLTRADAASATIPAEYSPSLNTIAADTGLNRASVKRHLNVLESAGWISRSRSTNAAADHQPTRYRLGVPPRRTESLGAESAQSPRRTESLGLGAQSSEARRTVRPNQTSTRPKPEQDTLPAARRPADPYAADGFSEFWDAYPRKVAKRAAATAYAAAVKRGADRADVIKGAERYRDDPGREPRFTPHPATWLNGDRWLDAAPERPLNRTERVLAESRELKARLRSSQNGATP